MKADRRIVTKIYYNEQRSKRSKYLEYTDEIVSRVFGVYDRNLSVIENAFNVDVRLENERIKVTARDSKSRKEACERFIDALCKKVASGGTLSSADVRRAANAFIADEKNFERLDGTVVTSTARGYKIVPKTINQKKFVDAVGQNDVTFAIGPAGTGKTYLAVALASAAYKRNEVEKIILTRPAIESGEKLGFLPGDLQTKVDPYLRPLYDALNDVFDADSTRLSERGVIEIAPLAFMRGRTLKNAYVILDEAQNTTAEQMKMFLTRLGTNSKFIVTGDDSQVDIDARTLNGLESAQCALANVDKVAFVRLTDEDVLRHDTVQKIVRAYADYEGKGDKDKARAKSSKD